MTTATHEFRLKVHAVGKNYNLDFRQAFFFGYTLARTRRFKEAAPLFEVLMRAEEGVSPAAIMLAYCKAGLRDFAASRELLNAVFPEDAMLPPDSHRAINVLQRSAAVVLQKSLQEGFGLTVTEALWKSKLVIGGACGGITLQVHDYHTGFLVHSPAGAAYRIRYLLRYAEKRQRIGQNGHGFVREHFLLTRHLRDYLNVLLCLDRPEPDVLVV